MVVGFGLTLFEFRLRLLGYFRPYVTAQFSSSLRFYSCMIVSMLPSLSPLLMVSAVGCSCDQLIPCYPTILASDKIHIFPLSPHIVMCQVLPHLLSLLQDSHPLFFPSVSLLSLSLELVDGAALRSRTLFW